MFVNTVFVVVLVCPVPGGEKAETTKFVSMVVTKPTGEYEFVTTFANERL